MIEGLVKFLVTNRQDAGLVGFLLVAAVAFVLALYKEWLYLGKPVEREREACAGTTKAMAEVSEKLVDQRILNERATMTIDMLTGRVRELEIDLARAEGNQWQRQQERPRR